MKPSEVEDLVDRVARAFEMGVQIVVHKRLDRLRVVLVARGRAVGGNWGETKERDG